MPIMKADGLGTERPKPEGRCVGTKDETKTSMIGLLKEHFWQPPRAHGDVIEDRSVSFVELFYDLVYVVLIARAAHTLAHHVTWRGLGEFSVIFGLIWIAWLNGTTYHELHGREDGRSRTYIFLQMLLLASLAVFAGDAAGAGGSSFAVIYSALLLLLTWLWYVVRLQDSEQYMDATGRYLAAMLISAAVIFGSAFIADHMRVLVWASFLLIFIGWSVFQFAIASGYEDIGMTFTDSMVERFGLFTIIVLGEVIVGVVDGLSEVDRNVTSVATGLIGLMIGFGFFWSYFDFVGGRQPSKNQRATAQWMYSHLPLSAAIAAAGAAMISLVEHASDARAPTATSWLLSASAAVLLLSLIPTMLALEDAKRMPELYRPVSTAVAVAAGAALLFGFVRPAPWILVTGLAAIPTILWGYAVTKWVRVTADTDV